jgi:hypothetical protein
MVSVAHGIALSICWDNHSSRTYVWIYGVSDFFSIMPDYSNGVWLREMMQLMLSNDTDSYDVARELIYMIMR